MAPRTLPRAWVERIFMRLQGVYGREFTAQFSAIDQSTGLDVGLENAKQVWAEELGSFGDWPEAIGYALQNLPERSPNVVRFRELCRHVPPRPVAGMLTHQMTDAQMASNRQRVRDLMTSFTRPKITRPKDDGLEWARRIVRNPMRIDGVPRSQATMNLARQALAEHGEDQDRKADTA